MVGPETLTRNQLRHQAAFAAKILKHLSEDDYNQFERLGRFCTLADLSTDRLHSYEDIFTELHSTLLPRFREQLIGLAEAVCISDAVLENPAPTLKLVIEMVPKLQLTLDRIVRVIDDVIPGQLLESNRTNDQHFGQFKTYRLCGLANTVRQDMDTENYTILMDFSQLIETVTVQEDHQSSERPQFVNPLEKIGDALDIIDTAIRWSKGSELHIIHHYWQANLISVDETLFSLLIRAHPRCEHPTQPVAQSVLPLIKLAKLFFKKFASEGMAKTNVPFCTEMSSDQLALLEKTAKTIDQSVLDILEYVQRSDANNPDPNIALSGEVKKLVSQFQYCLLLVDLYIVPLLAEINVGQSHTYFKTWIVTWNTLFSHAAHNAIQACQ
ncbi:hypothetical protein PTTG_12587 [Puccinia triticina 1-1 BBBD Race 1]|uniref:Uncharacterized protein n=2 Tax=Puccinia triticina TaxID=208348 RepID=A0A180GT18_PUCT1|nr:uncharacterized protein PtA15_10A151 [Puccinia triticina]OAV95519.1 hypothetical protein PTTG_12587 [Puccinia triticina 1-1 BBBD Race 1]WAQ88732.1 hypothetical protein PtA15_10A151 [Puccinia triticina]